MAQSVGDSEGAGRTREPYMVGGDLPRILCAANDSSRSSSAVAEAFSRTGDLVKGGQLEQISHLLKHGVNVALMYGDRDVACNVSIPILHSDGVHIADCHSVDWWRALLSECSLDSSVRVPEGWIHTASTISTIHSVWWAHPAVRQPIIHPRLPSRPHGKCCHQTTISPTS
jgi:hypothetical protein